jgi:hypothetical protein
MNKVWDHAWTVKQNHLWSTKPRLDLVILASIFALIMMILGIKGFTEGWFEPRYPLDLQQQLAILFFNHQKGCDCALVVYQAAANKVHNLASTGLRVCY